MKKIFIAIIAIFPVFAFAFNPIVSEPEEQYAVIPITGDVYVEQNLLGDLENFPDLYEFTTDVAVRVTMQLKQRDVAEPKPFGLLLVRQNDTDGGVTEVFRQNTNPADWSSDRFISLGMTFLEAPLVQRDVTPGTYRIEVNTPDNIGDYMLVLGEEPYGGGLWHRAKSVFITQNHFGIFPLFAFLSPYISLPILFLLSIYLWFRKKWDSVKI